MRIPVQFVFLNGSVEITQKSVSKEEDILCKQKEICGC